MNIGQQIEAALTTTGKIRRSINIADELLADANHAYSNGKVLTAQSLLEQAQMHIGKATLSYIEKE